MTVPNLGMFELVRAVVGGLAAKTGDTVSTG